MWKEEVYKEKLKTGLIKSMLPERLGELSTLRKSRQDLELGVISEEDVVTITSKYEIDDLEEQLERDMRKGGSEQESYLSPIKPKRYSSSEKYPSSQKKAIKKELQWESYQEYPITEMVIAFTSWAVLLTVSLLLMLLGVEQWLLLAGASSCAAVYYFVVLQYYVLPSSKINKEVHPSNAVPHQN